MRLALSLSAWGRLCSRYRSAFRAAWSQRAEWERHKFTTKDAEFLPAALSLQQTPVSPVPRLAAWLIVAVFLIAVLWAAIGKVDIVAVAQGKVIPVAGTQVLQPITAATIRSIHVRNGDHVEKGSLMLELDPTIATAERVRVQSDLRYRRIQVAQSLAMLTSLQEDEPPTVNQTDGMDDEIKEAQLLAEGEFKALRGKVLALQAEIRQRRAEHAAVTFEVKKLERLVPIATERANALGKLAEGQYVTRSSYLEKERERIERESDLNVQKGNLRRIDAAISQSEQQVATVYLESRYANLSRLAEAQQQVSLLSQDLIKAAQAEAQTRLISPITGTVQQLAVRTVGGVVTPAQTLLLVVPEADKLEVEAYLENKDVGFVLPDQEVEIKIEAFPYTKYGILQGRVVGISNDAIEDEKRGLIYFARISLDTSNISVNGHAINLTPGMAITAEIKTGRRRILEYFLDPFIQHASESIRER